MQYSLLCVIVCISLCGGFLLLYCIYYTQTAVYRMMSILQMVVHNSTVKNLNCNSKSETEKWLIYIDIFNIPFHASGFSVLIYWKALAIGISVAVLLFFICHVNKLIIGFSLVALGSQRFKQSVRQTVEIGEGLICLKQMIWNLNPLHTAILAS